jgi:hypothetical protein
MLAAGPSLVFFWLRTWRVNHSGGWASMPPPLAALVLPPSFQGTSDRRWSVDRRSRPHAGLQQQMCAALGPAHLLFLHKAFAHHRVDSRFNAVEIVSSCR